MRRVRPFVVLLMSLAVCLQGHASVRVMDASCPMQHAQAAEGMHHHAGHMDADVGHVEVHADLHDGSTHHCPNHLGCDPVSSAMVAVQVLPVIQQPIAQAPAGATPAFHSYTAFFLWRPPART